MSTQPSTNTRVHLVLPAFNEEDALPPLLGRVARVRQALGIDISVVVVDDGSSDQTSAVAQVWSRRLPLVIERHPENLGLGQTVRDGLLKAMECSSADDVIVVMDADNTHAPELVDTMLAAITDGSDVVIASRYQTGSRVRGLSRFRLILSHSASYVFRAFLPLEGVRDYTCGFRAYRCTLLQRMATTAGSDFCSRAGFECMVDLLLAAAEEGARFSEVPLDLRYDEKRGVSKMRIGRTIMSTLFLLWRWRRRRQRALKISAVDRVMAAAAAGDRVPERRQQPISSVPQRQREVSV